MQKITCDEWKEMCQKEFKEFNNLRIENKFCDVILRSRDGVDVNAHRIILSIRSNYFKNLFSSGMKDSYAEVLPLHVQGECLVTVITFIYTGILDLNLNEIKQIEEVVRCATYFQIDKLVDKCMEALCPLINDNNCLRLWRLANECFSEKLENYCTSYITISTNQIFKTESFLNNLSTEEMKKLLLSSECTKVKFNQNDNTPDLKELIRLRPMPPNKDLVLISKKIIQTLETSKLKASSSASENNIENVASFGHTVFNNYFLLSGGHTFDKDFFDSKVTNVCEYFSPIKKEWSYFPHLSVKRSCHECIFFNDKIYACGGLESPKTVEIFDFGIEKWTYGAQLQYARFKFGLAALNGAIYAIGGENEKNIEILDPRISAAWSCSTSNTWGESTDYTQCVSLNDQIYCFGRLKEPCIFETKVNAFIPLSNASSFHICKGFFKICALDGFIYMLRENEYVYKYDRYGAYVTYNYVKFDKTICSALAPLCTSDNEQ